MYPIRHNTTTRFVALLLAFFATNLHHEVASTSDFFIRRVQTATVVEDDSGSSSRSLGDEDGTADFVDTSNSNAFVPEFQQEIRGGFDVNSIIPWYAVFNSSIICGGALIWEDIVVTAAHCVQSGFPKGVRVGSRQFDKGGTVVAVNKYKSVIHPAWTGTITQGNDVAILKLGHSLHNEIAIINQQESVPVAGATFFVAGFGLIRDYDLPKYLQGVFLDYVENCAARDAAYNPTYHVCGNSTKEKGTCRGDSGSPVVITGTKTIVGINSYSDNSCNKQSLDVYTRASTYRVWIDQQVCRLSDHPPKSCSNAKNCFTANLFAGVTSLFSNVTSFFGF